MQTQVTANSINGATGQVTWTATLPDRDLDFLAQGETLAATFNVSVADGHGGSATEQVNMTFDGAEDLPQITSGAQTGAVTADARISLIHNGGFEDAAPCRPPGRRTSSKAGSAPRCPIRAPAFLQSIGGGIRERCPGLFGTLRRRSRRRAVSITHSTSSLRPIRSPMRARQYIVEWQQRHDGGVGPNDDFGPRLHRIYL